MIADTLAGDVLLACAWGLTLLLLARSPRAQPSPRPRRVALRRVALRPVDEHAPAGGNPVTAAGGAGSSSVETRAGAVETPPPGTVPAPLAAVSVRQVSPGCPACVLECGEDMDVRTLRGFGCGDLCVTHSERVGVLTGSGVDVNEFSFRLRLFVHTC